jgi:hypothetical protein
MTLPIRPAPPRIDVVCRGTPRERGRVQGEALRESIRGCAEAVYELEAFRLQKPWWLPLALFVWIAEAKAMRAVQAAVQHDLPGAWERLQGISEASGVPLRRVALVNALEPVLSDLSGTVITGAEAACSAVAVGPQRTGGRGAIVAHNFDYLPLVQPFYALRDERPTGGLRSLQFIASPQVGTIDGLNEAGLAVTYNYAFTTDLGSPAPTLSMRLAEVLASCRTVAAAVEYLTTLPRWGSGLIMLGDAAGETASLELTSTRHAVRSGTLGDVLSHANSLRAEETCAVQIAADAVHGPRAPTPLRGRGVHTSSCCRGARLAEAGNAVATFGPDEIARLMADHGLTGEPSADTVCMHSDYWHTTACLQLLPQDRKLRIAYAPACAARYVEFTFDE